MSLPKRQRRNITCENREYHWFFPQGRDWDHRADCHLIVQAADGEGRVLKVFRQSWPDVTPAFVAAAIETAQRAGWQPDELGAPFLLTLPVGEA